jgi:hypothetical protein
MTEPTAEELRELPTKDTWSDAEALALYHQEEGIEVCCGSPTPQYVSTEADRVRWSHCCRIASTVMGEPASRQGAGQVARTLYSDRETYVK